MVSSAKLLEFYAAAMDYLVPGWFMLRPSNPDFHIAASIKALFFETDDVSDVLAAYLKTKGAIKSDFDLHIAELIKSEGWSSVLKNHIDRCGQFAGDLHLLYGPIKDAPKPDQP